MGTLAWQAVDNDPNNHVEEESHAGSETSEKQKATVAAVKKQIDGARSPAETDRQKQYWDRRKTTNEQCSSEGP